jgi:hypothetical protein
MTHSNSDLCSVESPIEAPHVVYPKGPIRKIMTLTRAEDAIAGEIIFVKLSCTHEATLIGRHITQDAVVRCPACFYEKTK